MTETSRRLLWQAAEIDGQEYAVGPGDFRGFPAPGIAHLLKNPHGEDLVYVMGGEAVPLDVLDYPRLGKRFPPRYGDGPPDFCELGAPAKPLGPV